MKFVIVTDAYDRFLSDLHSVQPDLAGASFHEQRQAYYDTMFGSADFYAHAIQTLGHQCEEFVYNAVSMQSAWLREHQTVDESDDTRRPPVPAPRSMQRAVEVVGDAAFRAIARYPQGVQLARRLASRAGLQRFKSLARPLLRRLDEAGDFFYTVFREQLRSIRPDVLYNHSLFLFSTEQLADLRRYARRIVGQHAATKLPDSIDYRLYDLVLSSFPPTIDDLRNRGARAAFVRLAFDPRVAQRIPERPRDREVTFAGSLFRVHSTRLQLLEAVAGAVPQLEVYATTELETKPNSPLAGRIQPPLWGKSVFELLRRSVATLNHHGDVLPFANNMRLYEATGMGCLLVTDWKENLGEMFEPEKEVVTYRDHEECIDKLHFYLAPKNEAARLSIMRAGQRRTLAEHTYDARMRETLDLIEGRPGSI